MRLGGFARHIAARLRSEAGFGLIELLVAMVVTSIAVMALVATLSSSHVSVVRASRVSTAAAVASAQLETYRAGTYADIAPLGATNSTKVGADGRSYPITTTIAERCPNGSAPTAGACSGTPPTGGGRPLKTVTVTVKEPTNPLSVLVEESSAYDQLTLG